MNIPYSVVPMKLDRLLYLILFISFPLKASTLEVNVHELRSDKGSISFILFKDESGYPDNPDKSFRRGTFPADQKTLTLQDLPPGKYAMTFIHDENNNGKLDTTLGIPKEGFAFSNNPAVIFGPPSYSKARFKVPLNKPLKIKMKYL